MSHELEGWTLAVEKGRTVVKASDFGEEAWYIVCEPSEHEWGWEAWHCPSVWWKEELPIRKMTFVTVCMDLETTSNPILPIPGILDGNVRGRRGQCKSGCSVAQPLKSIILNLLFWWPYCPNPPTFDMYILPASYIYYICAYDGGGIWAVLFLTEAVPALILCNAGTVCYSLVKQPWWTAKWRALPSAIYMTYSIPALILLLMSDK